MILTLRDMTMADCPALLECGNDPEAKRYYDPSVFESLASLEKYAREYFLPLKEAVGIPAQIMEINGQLAGLIYFCYAKEEKGRKVTELAFVLHERYRGKGYGTRALRHMVRRGFEYLGFDDIRLSCYPDNAGSIHLAQKLGMEALESWHSDGKEILQFGISRSQWSIGS